MSDDKRDRNNTRSIDDYLISTLIAQVGQVNSKVDTIQSELTEVHKAVAIIETKAEANEARQKEIHERETGDIAKFYSDNWGPLKEDMQYIKNTLQHQVKVADQVQDDVHSLRENVSSLNNRVERIELLAPSKNVEEEIKELNNKVGEIDKTHTRWKGIIAGISLFVGALGSGITIFAKWLFGE